MRKTLTYLYGNGYPNFIVWVVLLISLFVEVYFHSNTMITITATIYAIFVLGCIPIYPLTKKWDLEYTNPKYGWKEVSPTTYERLAMDGIICIVQEVFPDSSNWRWSVKWTDKYIYDCVYIFKSADAAKKSVDSLIMYHYLYTLK